MRISSAELSLIQYPPEEHASLRERMEEAVKQDMENYYAATKSRESLKNKKKTAKYLEN